MNYSKQYLINAHDKSSSHKNEVLNYEYAGCFYCESIFKSNKINEWLQEPDGRETAICPNCNIDSVISSELPINDKKFLSEMNSLWFDS